MATYQRANDATHDFVYEVLEKYRDDLTRVETTIAVRFADAAEGQEHALKTKGYPVLAQITITPLKMRALGVADAVIDLDRAKWERLSEPEREALIDHELYHLELLEDEETGDPLSDDLGRPRLKSRPHDWEVEGFDVIAQRHKQHAPEVKAITEAVERSRQDVFPWG